MAGVVIAGAGQAAFQCIESLRQEGYEGAITLVGEESWLPYQRPPLSKDYLLGETDGERILYRPPAFYEQNKVELRLETTVTSIDPDQKSVELSPEGALSYEALVLGTGARCESLMLKVRHLMAFAICERWMMWMISAHGFKRR